jgi:hypothetical protein
MALSEEFFDQKRSGRFRISLFAKPGNGWPIFSVRITTANTGKVCDWQCGKPTSTDKKASLKHKPPNNGCLSTDC